MSKPEPHLILHKVREEPAFDVATCIGHDEDGTEMWIIPTSGHRAYPYWNRRLLGICDPYMPDIFQRPIESDPGPFPAMPDPWPDHYSCNNPGTRPTEEGSNLLERLGLGQKIERRF